jgi:hypothetical protein
MGRLEEAMTMTAAQIIALLWLSERGGSGTLDRYGRVCAGGQARLTGSWLRLVALGYIAGGNGRIWITDIGQKALTEIKRVASS